MIEINICNFAKCLRRYSIWLIFLISVLPKIKSDCVLLNPVNVSEAGHEKNILELISPLNGKVFETQDLFDPPEYTYKVSICDKIAGKDSGIGAVQIEKNNITHTIGRYDQVDVMRGTDWILLSYYGGENYHKHCNGTGRVTKIMIICDPDVLAGTFEILEERRSLVGSCYYMFELSSNVSCSKIPSGIKLPYGLSSGSVFCILFFTIASVYLICGFLYKRLIIGAKGLEQIPNYSFWRDFGNLQADGCDYFCRCGPRQESQAYRGIDDQLKMDEERDDQLLNM